jgi:multiple sugar transport system ATP-binding protein
MASIRFESVNKTFDSVQAVRDLNLQIGDGEFLTLLGPSGCGKTTTLNLLAGLEAVDTGKIWIGDRVVNDISPRDRNIALVFQSYALYPHMTVFENIAFPLKARSRVPKSEVAERVKAVARTLNIEDLLSRYPKEISGGQRQRTALGRAMVRNPTVFLMDEPLSNLDAQLRLQMRAELAQLYDDLKTTCVYVTHDQAEAMALSTKIAIMKDGCLIQTGTPLAVYRKPANKFVANFIGERGMNFADGQLVRDEGNVWFRAGKFAYPLPQSMVAESQALPASAQVSLGVRPEHVGLTLDPQQDGIAGNVVLTETYGSHSFVHLDVEGIRFVARTIGMIDEFYKGSIWVRFDPACMHLFDTSTGESIRSEERACGD